jgi:hypothetical protein
MEISTNDATTDWTGHCSTYDDLVPMQFPTYGRWIPIVKTLESG